LRGEAKTARGERRIDLDCGKRRDQRAAFEPFFQRPDSAIRAACLNDKQKGRVETECQQAWCIRASPFARGLLGETPQHEFAFSSWLGGLFGDDGKGEGERRGVIAIGLRPDLVQPPRLELVEGQGEKTAGGGGRGRDRARCGGNGQRHGNLLERANLGTQTLNQGPTPCPTCLFNASRRNEETDSTAWNVVTHATDLNSRSCFVLKRVGDRVKLAIQRHSHRCLTIARAHLREVVKKA
jgi:hypothetical protein